MDSKRPRQTTSEEEGIELYPDAMERLEQSVKTAARHGHIASESIRRLGRRRCKIYKSKICVERRMKTPKSVKSAEAFGRVRLSQSFFMRDFLHSEIAAMTGMHNLPDDPDLAIAAGRNLCEHLLEPLQANFGRLAIRSAYRSPEVNAYGNAHFQNCGSNERNRARHIWGSAQQRWRHGSDDKHRRALAGRSFRQRCYLAGNGVVDSRPPAVQ